MRTKKAGLNLIINVLTVLLGFLPLLLVRKVFLETLGGDLLGLNSLYTSIVGLLALAEMGITTAIIYSLYKPFADNNHEKIKAYLQYYTKFYQIVGFVIFTLGLVTLPFLNVFVQNDVNMRDSQMYFLLFLANTIITYFFSAKFSILIVAQEGYKVAIGMAVSKFTVAILQILLLSVYPNFYYFLIVQLIVNLLYFAAMNFYIRKRYSWLSTGSGKLEEGERRSLTHNIKALFMHKIGEVAVFSTDNLIISCFISLTVVGIFNSYNMIIAAFAGVVSSGLSGVTASIGNFMVAGKATKIFQIHKRLFFFSFWVVSFLIISLSNTLRQFVILWLGESQFLRSVTIGIILLNFYFSLMRASVEKFKEAGGLHTHDRYAALIEAGVNLVASLVLVKYLGLPGVFLGTLISNLLVVFWVKPRVVYKYIFKEKLSSYFLMYFKFFSIGLVALAISFTATSGLQQVYTIEAFIINCFMNIVIINSFYLLVFWNNEEFNYFRGLIGGKLKSRKINVSVK